MQRIFAPERTGIDAGREREHLAVSPETLFSGGVQNFAVFIERDGRMILFLNENERFTEGHAAALRRSGVRRILIPAGQAGAYNSYLEKRLPFILSDAAVPLASRAQILYDASVSIVRELFEQKLPEGLGGREYARMERLVRKSAAFLSNENSLTRLAALMNHDYGVYSHSVQVFVYAATLMQSLKLEEETIVQAGIGALLHDAGKEGIDQSLLQKPGPLTAEERRIVNTHPAKGAAFCGGMGLSRTALSCILLHHERMDASGYPGRLPGELIPLHVRAVTLADVYDALTSNRPYAAAVTPYEALRIMRDDMPGAFDLDLYKRLVAILSGADIV